MNTEIRTMFEIYSTTVHTSTGDAQMVGRGGTKAEAWSDAQETTGVPIEELEDTCYAVMVDEERDPDTGEWVEIEHQRI